MAKTKTTAKKKPVKGQQDLIDVCPKNIKEIVLAAKRYREFLTARQQDQRGEEQYKQKVKELVKEAKLQPLEDGVIRFSYDGFTISLTPRDLLIQIVEEEIKPPKDK